MRSRLSVIVMTFTLVFITLHYVGCKSDYRKWMDKVPVEIRPAVEKYEEVFHLDSDDTEDSTEDLPFSKTNVKWCVLGGEDVIDWQVTLHLETAVAGKNTTSWSYSLQEEAERQKAWPKTHAIKNDPNACVGAVIKRKGDDQWYGIIGEWLLSGQQTQSSKLWQSDRGNMKAFLDPLKTMEMDDIEEAWMFVCGLNWNGQRNVRERSTFIQVIK